MKNKSLITTAIAYANGAPHIGHAFEFVLADTIARFEKKTKEVFFITGMDEHGQKIEQKAKEKNISVYDFVNEYAEAFKDLDKELAVSYDYFVRTSDKERHYIGATSLWNKLMERGDLEKRSYKALYCVGCEEFKNEKDLNEGGECPAHLKKPEVVEEENYFFKLSKYTDEIKSKIENGDLKIYPDTRKNEIVALLERGLEDVSFSRPKSKVAWGVPVPGDEDQVMYVWCDALSNYITAIGYGTETFDAELWDNTLHIVGKDILRFHAAIWPGMLLSAGLSLPKRILVHGHITSGGQKMSKSLGNVIDPKSIIELFREVAGDLAGEVTRFVLLYRIPTFEDGDLTIEAIKEMYVAHLQNGLGNLTNRVMKMATTHGVTLGVRISIDLPLLTELDVHKALNELVLRIGELDKRINDEAAFKVVKVDEVKGKELIAAYVVELEALASALSVFMPQTSAKILECIAEHKMPEKPLFNRFT